MSESFLDTWKEFSGLVGTNCRKLTADLADLNKDIVEITTGLQTRYAAALERSWERDRIGSLRAVFEDDARSLLTDPLARYSRLRISERVFRVFEDFRTNLAEVARKLPMREDVAPVILIETLPQGATLPKFFRGYGWRDTVRSADVRPAVLQRLDVESFNLSRLEGGVYLSFAQATLSLLDPWQALRAHALMYLRNDDPSPEDLPDAQVAWMQQVKVREEKFGELLTGLEQVLAGIEPRLVGAVLGPERLRRLRPAQSKRRAAYDHYWGRQQRSVQALAETEKCLVRLGSRAVGAAEESLSSVKDEHLAVRDELLAAIESLKMWNSGMPNPLPDGSAQLTPALEKTRRWQRALASQARQLMPGEIESTEPHGPLPGRLSPWRALKPQQSFLDALDEVGARISAILEDVESDHKLVLREIERAREVVSFGIASAADEGESDGSVARESVDNAISLLDHAQGTLVDRGPAVESALTEATASSFYQYHVGFEHGRVSLVSYLAREGAARGVRRASGVALEQSRAASLALWRGLVRLYHALLVKIGWEAPIERVEVPVARWPSLEEGADIDLGTRRLPLIYGRLFRTDPVKDLRFLVGRDAEMAALVDARNVWESGRFAAALVVGQRGSGKTSLINCSLSRSFQDCEVIRGKFHDRILAPGGMRAFLAGLLKVPVENLESSLAAGRRVIVIEELERTYIRRVGGLVALEELSEILTSSARQNLWILSLAGAAFRYLGPASGIAEHFSHRINASSVTPDDIREAIVQRHNLSGLRLEFSLPPTGGRVWEWLDRRAGIRQDPETAFFDALYRQSGGVFRSAFGLWLRSIDRAEGGVLYMRFPESPDRNGVTSDLSGNDVFTLMMIMQHGSLTPEEHAEIFGLSVEASLASLEHLLGRQLLEPEPDAPGLRIRPSALVLVRSALSAQNLM